MSEFFPAGRNVPMPVRTHTEYPPKRYDSDAESAGRKLVDNESRIAELERRPPPKIHTFGLIIGDGVNVPGTGFVADYQFHAAYTIVSWTLLANISGSIVVNIWKDTYANFPPTSGDKITASAPPTLSGATKATSSTLTGWNTAINFDDILRFNIDSVATLTRVTLALKLSWVADPEPV